MEQKFKIDVYIADIETYLELFLFKAYLPKEDRFVEFQVSRWKNQLSSMFIFMESYKNHYFVSYNGLSFDAQVLEWVYRNYESWNESSGLEICSKISQKAQDVIDNSNYEIFPEYRESDFSFKHIDLFRISHFDNKNFRVSLKRLQFEMDMENIEELPIPFDKRDLTQEEIEIVSNYCSNDVFSTYQFWLYIIGEVEHPLYKGNNQIQLRVDIESEFKIPCMNYSEAKIGDEIIKKYYCEAKGISYNQLPRKGFFRKKIELKYCVPKCISFKTEKLQEFLSKIKKISLGVNEDFVENIEFYGQKYSFMKGGLHNVINGKVYESNDDFVIKDIDVGGFYPAAIINESYYPFHLGKEFLVGYSKVYFKRDELKPLAKKDKKIKGIVAAYKKATNCPYGKSSDMQSWLYDKQMTLATCITGELSLLMLIEDCELNGIKCIMANTDGASFIVPRKNVDIFDKIKEEWLYKTTNKLTYTLEETDYEKMVFSTVNDYIAIKADENAEERVKLKGDFMKDFALEKNHSARICPIALEKYYVDDIPVEETIKNHKNIYDFAIRQKASKDFHYEGIRNIKAINIPPGMLESLGWFEHVDGKWGHPTDKRSISEVYGEIKKKLLEKQPKSVYNKLIRYYVSNKGEKLLKIKNESCVTNAAPVSQVEAGDYLMTVCNFLPRTTKIEDCDLNYQYYIDRCYRIIDKIALGGKKRKINPDKQQMSLFG